MGSFRMPLVEPRAIVKKTKKSFHIPLPKMPGKFGLSIMAGNKEYFLGLTVSEVIVEQLVRKQSVKLPKARTTVYTLD